MLRSILRRELSPRRRPPGSGSAILAAALLTLATAAPHAWAQFTWNNPAGGNWSVGGNWQAGTAPASSPTTALVFGSPATQATSYTATNDIVDPFQLNALTINNTAGTVTLAGSPLSFAGASPTVTVGDAGSMTLSPAATLAATTTIAGPGSGGFTFGGAVAGGSNNLVKTSVGTLTLAGGGSLNALQLAAGTTNVTGGTLALTLANTAAESLLMGTAAGQTATLNLTGGRVDITEHARIGQAAGSTGIVSVSGAGTVLANTVAGTTGIIRVGANGTGSLSVTAGATVNALNLYLGLSVGSTGDMLIDGPGSTVNSSYMFRVGTGGNGTLTVRNGGTLNAGTVSANFAFIVGNIGVGNLTLRDGGRINSPAFFIGYGGTGDVPGIGTTTVTGTGAVLTVSTPTAGGFLGVGMTTAGDGTLNVQNGGQVVVNGDTLGAVFAGRGTINVTDPGSLLQTRGIALGGDFSVPGGTATLNVGAAGTVTVAARASLHTGGTINLNAGGAMSVGTLVDGRFNSTGVVNLAAGTSLTITDGSTTFSGPIRGAGGLAMTGAGVQTLAGANTYTGNTVISSGTVRLLSTGSLASQRITVGTAPGSSAVFDVSAFSSFSLTANQTLAGHGTVAGTVTVAGGAAVAPGTNVGTLNVADMAWLGGGRYDFEFAGTTGDLLNGTGSLNLSSLNGTDRFTINIQSFDASLTTPQTYTLATFAGGISGFDATPGSPQFTFAGLFVPGSASVSLQGNSLRLTFTPVAESAHLLVLCALAAIARLSARTSVSPTRPGSRAER
jgi:fibronectin-binding autotransporter adhesin